MADDELHEPARASRFRAPAAPRDVPDEEIAAVRDIDFPVAMRGYDRAAVDAYVTRVNRIIAELQVTRSPQSAIRHALDEMSEETKSILARAHESAEEITRRSRTQADDRLQTADREARQLIADANARVRELAEDADEVRRERNRLLEDVRQLAEQLLNIADDASERFPPEPGEPEADTVTFDESAFVAPSDEPDDTDDDVEDDGVIAAPPPPPPPRPAEP